MTALGRQEESEASPEGYPQTPPYAWWIWHDEPRESPIGPGWQPAARPGDAWSESKALAGDVIRDGRPAAI